VKVLFLTSRLPFPPIGGDKLRTFNFIRHISARHRVTIISFLQDERELKDIGPYRRYYERLITVPLPRTRSYLNCVTWLFSNEPLQIHYYRSARMREAVQAELATGYDVVFCHLIRMAQYLPEHGPARQIIDFTDAISQYHRRSREFRKDWSASAIVNAIEARRVLPFELSCMRKADVSIFISRAEIDFYGTAAAGRRLEVVTSGVDCNEIEFSTGEYDRNRIVFMGNMRTFHNTDAAVYFANEVFPIIRKSRPAATFHIVGNEPSRRVRRLHDGTHVVVTGFVDDVSEHMRNAAVLVAPMRVCAGVQTKVLEALALGVPVVATPMGATDFDANVLSVADTAEGLAAATLRMMNDDAARRERALAGRQYVERNRSRAEVLAGLDDLLADHSAPAQTSR